MVKQTIKRLTMIQHVQNYVAKTPAQALRTVISKEGLGVYASSDTMYKGAVFGRDSIEVAEDLIHLKPKLVKRIVLTLASLQGEEFKAINEEEPGKIVHEYRKVIIDGKPIRGPVKRIFEELSSLWGGDDQSLAYYGSIDASPHFIRLVCRYCQLYGSDILNSSIRLRSGHRLSLRLVLDNTLSWLTKQLEDSRSGLLEFYRHSPNGSLNQVWKDSNEFYVHDNGEVVNHGAPVSSIEVQGLAYDALMMAAELFPSRQKECQKRAKKLQDRTIKLLWQPRKKYFSLGTDFDEKGHLRKIRTETANPAGLLDTSFFDSFDLKKKRKYVSGIARSIMGTHFLTDAGIRSRGLAAANLVPFWDYHGSYSSWPKETYDIAKGLRRQGFPLLARELENRLLNIVKAFKSYPEFIFVDYRGRVLGVSSRTHHHAEPLTVKSTDRPERIQAWTVSAVMAINAQQQLTLPSYVSRMIKKPTSHQPTWQHEVEKEILAHIPLMPKLKSAKELSARYPAYPYQLEGARADKYTE